ncbi:MAPEG family protein [Variovorax sp. H27-G14]|uniref:MAPEG family protein n=1 Tax=Variovorax sp. H27-G14 TaxID=3111914 RepID=UPI0038FC57D1
MTFSLLTVAYWCVLIACVLPYFSAWVAKAGSFGPRDNVNPRDWAARQSGWRARANSAQANSFEGLPFFIGAVVIAHQLGVVQSRLDLLAVAYVVLRMIYVGLYIKGIGGARSAVWALAFLVNIAILFLGR